jgi:hypothetical protein
VAIVPLKRFNQFPNYSSKQVYRLINNELNPDFKSINPSLYDIAILNTIGEPSYIIGSGLSGEPSAAVLDINGQFKMEKIMAMMRWERPQYSMMVMSALLY